MVIPIYDNDPLEKSHRAYVNWALIALNLVIFLIEAGLPDKDTAIVLRNFALHPVDVVGGAVTGGHLPPTLTLVTYMFLHGGWAHVLMNMLFLWVFGDNIEDALGRARYLVFYLLCGVGGGLAHVLAAPQSNVALVGASGAIAGIIAAYLMLRPCAKITVLIFIAIPIKLASYWVLGFWILTQMAHLFITDESGTAWWAHVGGLLTGAVLILVMRPAGVLLFECMRPEDVVVAADSGRTGPWGSAR